MREAAATVREAGLDPWCAGAIAERQAWVADLARQGVFDDAVSVSDWRTLADRIRCNGER